MPTRRLPAILKNLLLPAVLIMAASASPQLPAVTESPPHTTDFSERVMPSDPDRTVLLLRFSSPVHTAVNENNTAEAHITIPRDAARPMPVVVLLHYWGATDFQVEERLARDLAARGIASAMLVLPYHMRRSPQNVVSGKYAIRPDVDFLKETITQAVMDVKRLIDYLTSKSDFNPNAIGLTGISLGAVVGSLIYAVEPRITAAALLLGGVDIAHLIWHSSVTIETRNGFRRQGYTEDRLREALASVEPMNYANSEKGSRLLVVGAKYDEVVPTEDTRKLIDAFGQPIVLWLDSGHYGGAIVERRLYRNVAEFFLAKFFNTEYNPPPTIRTPTLRVGVHYNPEFELTVGIGLDLWRSRDGKTIVNAMITTEGPALFGGQTVTKGLMAGIVLTPKGPVWGLFWSVIL